MKRRHAFTVIEMLLVMAVAGILLSISLPAFTKIAAGKLTTRAANQVSAKLQLARALAVSRNEYVAAIFPKVDSSGKLEGVGTVADARPYCNASIRLASVWKDTTTPNTPVYKFMKWIPSESWETFPEGVVIPQENINFGVRDASKNTALSTMTNDPLASVNLDSLIEGQTVSSVSRVVLFSPSGQIVMPSGNETKDFVIRVAEGTLDPISQNDFIIKKDAQNKVTYSVLLINPLTGRVKIDYATESL